MRNREDRIVKFLEWCLWGYALFMPISIAVSEPLAYLALPLWLYLLFKKRLKFIPAPYSRFMFFFVLVAVITAIAGVRPELSLKKLDRFLLLGVVLIIPSFYPAGRNDSAQNINRLILLFLAGSTLQALYDMFRVPVEVMRGVGLFHTGNMRDPQIYMAALCCLLAAVIYQPDLKVSKKWIYIAFVINVIGLILHFKRGAWISFAGAATIMAVVSGRKRILIYLVLCALVVLALPQVRGRLAMLREESSIHTGGRISLWTQVAPVLIKEHPWGMGWKAPKHEDFRAVTRHLQPKLNHLHSNLLEITLELGWIGLAVWLAWIGRVFHVLWISFRRLPRELAWPLGLLGSFSALMINGVVEYNFGDTEIFMMLCFIMGLSAFFNHQKSSVTS